MKKLLARLPHPIFILLLLSHLFFFFNQLLFAHAKVRSAAVLLLVIIGLVSLSALAHFIPPLQPAQLPQLSDQPQTISLTKPQLAQAVMTWQDIYQKQPRSETVALTLRALCQAADQADCVNQTTQTLLDLNPALLSPTPANELN